MGCSESKDKITVISPKEARDKLFQATGRILSRSPSASSGMGSSASTSSAKGAEPLPPSYVEAAGDDFVLEAIPNSDLGVCTALLEFGGGGRPAV